MERNPFVIQSVCAVLLYLARTGLPVRKFVTAAVLSAACHVSVAVCTHGGTGGDLPAEGHAFTRPVCTVADALADPTGTFDSVKPDPADGPVLHDAVCSHARPDLLIR